MNDSTAILEALDASATAVWPGTTLNETSHKHFQGVLHASSSAPSQGNGALADALRRAGLGKK